MKYQNLIYGMLPEELKNECKKIIPSVIWRQPSVYSILGQLEVGIGQAKRLNDFSLWKKQETLGNKIIQWINEDKSRREFWDYLCANKAERDTL